MKGKKGDLRWYLWKTNTRNLLFRGFDSLILPFSKSKDSSLSFTQVYETFVWNFIRRIIKGMDTSKYGNFSRLDMVKGPENPTDTPFVKLKWVIIQS